MKQLLFLLTIVALLSSCESKSGHRAAQKPNASFVFVAASDSSMAPRSISMEQMRGYEAVGTVRLCGPAEGRWDVVVLKPYKGDSAIYMWNPKEAKYLFLNYKSK